MKNIFHEKVLSEYRSKQKANKDIYEKQMQEFYEKFPAIKDIDDKIAALAITHAARIITEGITPEDAVKAVVTQRRSFEDKKNELLNTYNVSLPQMKYDCDLCKDTGFILDKKCKCYMENMQRVMISSVNGAQNVLFDVNSDTFDNFSLDWYSKTDTVSPLNITPYENMKSVYAECISFCTSFNTENKNLYFYGSSGTGKTFLASCIANDLIQKGYNVVYQSAYKLFQFMEDYKFGRIEHDTELYEQIYNADLLIIDDLGTEFSTAYTHSVFFDILNTRLLNSRSTIISSNLNLSDLEKKYTDRIQSRIIGNFEILRFMGDDIRIQKKQNG